MSPDISPNETAPHGTDEGIALAFRAQDDGNWKPLVDWLARNPDSAATVARFLGGDRDVGRAVNPPRPAARVGTVLGEYELLEVLGRGQMGVVYRGVNRRIGQQVAVKVIETAGLTEGARARVRFEVEALAGLSHKNVVPLYASGETDTELYFVMPLLAGGSLQALIARGHQLTPTRVAELVRAIALGVHHAHQHGLLHRDLKPANVMLDADGNPHVADFGLARPLDATFSVFAGTAAYMAPEQASGSRRLTTAADVHALGVILFELLTGKIPFLGNDIPSTLKRVIEDPVPRARAIRPDVPTVLELVCTRCLKKNPEDRYQSAAALAADLTNYLKGEPISETRDGGVWNTVLGALGGPATETNGMGSWRIFFWGALSTLLAMTVMQVAVLFDAPKWVPQAALVYYLVGWLLIMWRFLVARRDLLNRVERLSTVLHFGAKFACTAILPAQLWLHDGDALCALPSFLAIVGVVVFAHGFVYWGQFYLIGLGLLLAVALLPLVPQVYWPSVYGALLGVLQLWGYHHLRRVNFAIARGADRSALGS